MRKLEAAHLSLMIDDAEAAIASLREALEAGDRARFYGDTYRLSCCAERLKDGAASIGDPSEHSKILEAIEPVMNGIDALLRLKPGGPSFSSAAEALKASKNGLDRLVGHHFNPSKGSFEAWKRTRKP